SFLQQGRDKLGDSPPTRDNLLSFLNDWYDWNSLGMMLKIELDREFDALIGENDYHRRVVERAAKQGWLQQLLAAAVADRPHNPALAAYNQRYGQVSDPPTDELCQALQMSFEPIDLKQCLTFRTNHDVLSIEVEDFALDVLEN